ncbi:hypothetical protein [Streptomyces sp. NPDC020965]|uniref:hypothetical protein n=1 Tax=Streptomyces sp. NPDC020965 TaxID=3365105 RepID=UPI00379BF80C
MRARNRFVSVLLGTVLLIGGVAVTAQAAPATTQAASVVSEQSAGTLGWVRYASYRTWAGCMEAASQFAQDTLCDKVGNRWVLYLWN